MKTILVSGIISLLSIQCLAAVDDELASIRATFFDREYSSAIKQLDALILGLSSPDARDGFAHLRIETTKGDEEQADYPLYLKCLAQFYEKDFSNAIGSCEQFLSKYQESSWYRKAIFLKAQCHIQLKQFKEAEEIYEAEAKRLLSAARKEEIASVYVRFAEALSRKPAKDELDAPPPNYEIEGLDIALIAPDKTWEYQVKDYQKYKLFSQEIEIPMEGAGVPLNKGGQGVVYAVNISETDLEATTLLIRSDIDTIIKTSRKEVLVFAEDMLKGEPAPKAKVLVSDGTKVIYEGETEDDGVFHKKLDELKQASQASVFVIRDGSVASNLLDISELNLSKGLSSRGYLYTDRPAYRPGQKVSIRGIIRDVKEGSYLVSAGAIYKLSVLDSQGRLIREEEVKLSDFGTFHIEMKLDESVPVGDYRITAQLLDDDGSERAQSRSYTGDFQVQKCQLEKMKLAIDFPQRVYFRGEKIEATFTASYYYGAPVANRPIKYTLPNGQSYTEETDAEGKLKVVFDTAYSQPGTMLSFSGSIEGENVLVADTVYLAHLGFSIKVKPSAEVVLSGETFDVSVETVAADGKPVGKELTLTLFRKTKQRAHPILSQIPWLVESQPMQTAEVKVEEHNITTDAKDGKGRIQLDLEKGGVYVLRASGVDRFDQPVSGEGSVTISDDEDAVKLRIFTEKANLKVGSKEKIRIHSRVGEGKRNVLFFRKAVFAKKYKNALVTFEGEGIISYRILRLKENWNDIEFAVGHEHFPNFYMAVAVMEGRKLRTAGKEFTVERQLIVSIKPAKETYLPGEEAEIEIFATDAPG